MTSSPLEVKDILSGQDGHSTTSFMDNGRYPSHTGPASRAALDRTRASNPPATHCKGEAELS